jgi:glutamine cyclotransferase
VIVATWKESKLLIYQKEGLFLLKTVDIPVNPVVGLATDGLLLYVADGTDAIHVLDPNHGFVVVKVLKVRQGKSRKITSISEIHITGNDIWANIWFS